jgi:hypothetical protein
MKKSVFTKKKVLVATAVILAVGGAYAGYHFFIADNFEPPGQPTSPINYDPPTEEEEADSQARKDALAQQQAQQADSNKKQVTPVVTNASQRGSDIFLSAYVPGVAEEGGKCTYKITQGGSTVTKVTDGFVNVSNTNCTPVEMKRGEFNNSGDWQVTVSYSSVSASGVSQSKTLTVQ